MDGPFCSLKRLLDQLDQHQLAFSKAQDGCTEGQILCSPGDSRFVRNLGNYKEVSTSKPEIQFEDLHGTVNCVVHKIWPIVSSVRPSNAVGGLYPVSSVLRVVSIMLTLTGHLDTVQSGMYTGEP